MTICRGKSLVGPLQNGTDEVTDQFLATAGIRVLAVDRALARVAAQLRATHPPLRLPDAMCLAAALQNDAVFLRFDEQLIRLDEQIR